MTAVPQRKDPLTDPAVDPSRWIEALGSEPGPPGDPVVMRLLATAYTRRAEDVRQALAGLRAVEAGTSGWHGTAADSARHSLGEPRRRRLDDLPARYDTYATVVRSYADALDDAQPQVAYAKRQMLAVGRTTPMTAADADRTLRAAVNRYIAVWNSWVDAATPLLRRLHTADHADSLTNPHGWHAFVDELAHVSGDLSVIAGVLAFVPGIGELAAAALLITAAAASAVALGSDLTRRELYHESVNGYDIAADALGVLPIAGSVRGVAAGARSLAELGGAVRAGGL